MSMPTKSLTLLILVLVTLTTPLAVSAQDPPPLYLTSLEPGTVVNNTPHTLSLYGSGFTAECVVRVVGYGLLSTSYVNAGALTALLSSGIPAGTYTLEVGDGTRTAALSNALAVRNPDAPAEPPKAPPPGQPRLTIRTYAVEPAQVKAGEEFAVTIEIYNNGSRAGENTLAVFPGGTFLPLGEKGHLLWQLHINHTVQVTQRFRAPDTLSSGVHQVRVDLSANDWEGSHFDFPHSVPVEVIGKPTGTGFTGSPKVTIENAVTDPPVLVPGEPFSLTLRLTNHGSRTAVNVFTTAASGELVVPASGGDTVYAEAIGIEETVTVTLPLILGPAETGGRRSLAIALAYSDYDGQGYSDQQNIGVDVNPGLIRRPQIVIASYTTAPDFLAPGDTFTLTLRLTNVGTGEAERMTLALGGEGGGGLAPFIPLNAGNVLFVDRLAAGAEMSLSQALIIDGAAEARAVSLPIGLAYEDALGNRTDDTQRLSIIVRKRPELQVSLYREPGPLAVGMAAPVALEVVNTGRSGVNVVGIEAAAPQLESREDGLPFIGTLDPGGSAPLDLVVTPLESGSVDLTVSIAYRDDFNEARVISDTIELDVIGGEEGPDRPGGEGPNIDALGEVEDASPETAWKKLGRAIRGFFGLGS